MKGLPKRKVFLKLKCGKCNEVKRHLGAYTKLLRHKLTMTCPDCGEKMYVYQSGGEIRPGMDKDFFKAGIVPYYNVPRMGNSR